MFVFVCLCVCLCGFVLLCLCVCVSVSVSVFEELCTCLELGDLKSERNGGVSCVYS